MLRPRAQPVGTLRQRAVCLAHALRINININANTRLAGLHGQETCGDVSHDDIEELIRNRLAA